MNIKNMDNETLLYEFERTIDATGNSAGGGSLSQKAEFQYVRKEVLSRMQGWVSVDTPPDENVPVLVVTKEGWITAAKYVFEDGWHWEQLAFGGYLDEPSNYEWDDDYEYTHWMPLPQSPKELK